VVGVVDSRVQDTEYSVVVVYTEEEEEGMFRPEQCPQRRGHHPPSGSDNIGPAKVVPGPAGRGTRCHSTATSNYGIPHKLY